MKDIGDKLRRCDDGTCSPNDIDKVVRTVLVKDRMVAILVRTSFSFIFYTFFHKKIRM